MSFSFHYIQFLSLTISFSPARFLILDISCYFPAIISNFCLLQFLFHLLCSSFWTFLAISVPLYPISVLYNSFFTCTVLDFGYFLLFSCHYIQFLSPTISFSSALLFILDISCYFLFIMSNLDRSVQSD